MKIEIPTNCPTCGSTLELVNAQLFCRNNSCAAQSLKKVEAYAKKMKIKGLGAKTIEKLGLEAVPDIYLLNKTYLVEVLGEKIGEKLNGEIEKSKNTEFSTFLSSLSIPLIGTTAANKLADSGINSLEELTPNKYSPVLGPKASENLRNWLYSHYNEYSSLPITFRERQAISTKSLGKVCITGKLDDFKNRNEASEFLKGLGYRVTTTVNTETDYLVDEEGKPSSKRKKAEQLNIQIVSIKQLKEIIE